MLNADEILFSKNHLSESIKGSNILFNTNIDSDSNMLSVDVSYFSLKKNKTLGNDNVVKTDEQLMLVGFCDTTEMINVCYFDGKYHIYFWVYPDEVNHINTIVEYWEFNDARLHFKSINEEWTIKKNTEKTLKKNKNKEKTTEQKEKKKRKLKN